MPFGIVAGAVIGAIGSNMAASTQADAQNRATDTQRAMYDTTRQQEQPFIQPGYAAENALQYAEGIGSASDYTGKNAPPPGMTFGEMNKPFNPTQAQLEQYPGYQFAKSQGDQAVRNSDTPGSGALSGAALKDLSSFNVGNASTYYNQFFNQQQTQQNNIFNRLSQIATLGQKAAGNLGSAGTTLGTGIAQSQAAAGASRAGGIAAASGGIGNSISMAGMINANSNSNTGTGSYVNSMGQNVYDGVSQNGGLGGGMGNLVDAVP